MFTPTNESLLERNLRNVNFLRLVKGDYDIKRSITILDRIMYHKNQSNGDKQLEDYLLKQYITHKKILLDNNQNNLAMEYMNEWMREKRC